jgi:ribosomal protein S18 acetylase RimI-like enzyme
MGGMCMKQVETELHAVEFVPVKTKEQIEQVAALAGIIWREHYEPIIGRDQVEYMLEHFQGAAPITQQIKEEGYQYYLLFCHDGAAGYIAVHKEENALFLSKFYISKEYRGRGYARRVISFLENYCRDNVLDRIWLTVNKHNDNSIAAYERLGFRKAGTQVADIGGGYVMDDYIMEKSIH